MIVCCCRCSIDIFCVTECKKLSCPALCTSCCLMRLIAWEKGGQDLNQPSIEKNFKEAIFFKTWVTLYSAYNTYFTKVIRSYSLSSCTFHYIPRATFTAQNHLIMKVKNIVRKKIVNKKPEELFPFSVIETPFFFNFVGLFTSRVCKYTDL